MSRLADLLRRAGLPVVEGLPESEVEAFCLDSRRARPGSVFAALRGSRVDGNEFADAALAAGCVAVLTDRPECGSLPGRVLVPSVGDALGPLCRQAAGEPDRGVPVFAVTGTNGKTSTATLAEAIFAESGRRPALTSTVVNRFPGLEEAAAMTTPDAVAFWDFARRARAAGADAFVVEASSHALRQGRIGGLEVDMAVFTNLTRDHLDYHGSFASYFGAKSVLFTRYLAPGGIAVANLDDAHGRILREQLGRGRVVGYTLAGRSDADWRIDDLRLTLSGLAFALVGRLGRVELESPLLGQVFAQNLAGAAIAFLEAGYDADAVRRGARRVRVAGRCELVEGAGRRGVVDYAHTPDALERLLSGLRPLVPGRLVCVFGCGGDRDRGKRPIMGGIAASLADLAVVTSDNPRTEDPEAILDEILAGIPDARGVLRVADRREAIRRAARDLGEGDLLVLAGKGHEDYQIIGAEKRHFDDREELRLALAGGAP